MLIHNPILKGFNPDPSIIRVGDDWLRLEGGGNTPKVEVPAPKLVLHPFDTAHSRDDFDCPELDIHFQWLRGDIFDKTNIRWNGLLRINNE